MIERDGDDNDGGMTCYVLPFGLAAGCHGKQVQNYPAAASSHFPQEGPTLNNAGKGLFQHSAGITIALQCITTALGMDCAPSEDPHSAHHLHDRCCQGGYCIDLVV